MFQFKQFAIDQTNCAMKINTDGVLLGALAETDGQNILDIGTGTGVIALMLAQRFAIATVDAVEIDEHAAETADSNFKNSIFADRVNLYAEGFESYLNNSAKKYDLIVSNPPFYINSLESPKAKKNIAKHAGGDFFENLVKAVASKLTESGTCWLILPLDTADLVKGVATREGLNLQKLVSLRSFDGSAPHREILVFGHHKISAEIATLVIYKAVGVYSAAYKQLLQPYFIAF
jgi:tRNA1Val (adenine37-N6)-methyltransferase